jgi:hypothetical protein
MKKTVLLLVIVGFLFSCNNSDGTNQITNELNGDWNLISVRCFCEPINLETGEHIWEFNLTENELNVTNNVSQDLHTILETGTYDINVIDSKITILNVEYDFYFENGKLYLTNQPESDGPIIEFIKE